MSVTAAPADSILTATSGVPIRVEKWPSEEPLMIVSVIVAILMWIVLTVSIIGIAYAAMLAVLFFFMHVGFVAHIRGNGVRLSREQFPELHERVAQLAGRMGMEKMPETYLIQAGGALNAFATRLFGSNMLVLYTDLLEACGDDEAARDMIIGHELGHIRSGHLRWQWFMLPAYLFPFLGSALSRAREYTCDRFGLASAGNRDSALLGLSILAGGAKYGRTLNRAALVAQRADLNTGWMTIGQWLGSHPPLAKRLLAIEPELGRGQVISNAGVLRAICIVGVLLLPPIVAGWLGVRWISDIASTAMQAGVVEPAFEPLPPEVARARLDENVAAISSFLESEVAAGRSLPVTQTELQTRWIAAHPGEPLPRDPFDGASLGYESTATGYILWSSGPDRVADTSDDITFPSDGQVPQ